ncbi:MAG: PD40 domain-containing protein [Anaerolineae bacterium]|nr:PD40 domain-containing protein [Anaerolineae bacterium]
MRRNSVWLVLGFGLLLSWACLFAARGSAQAPAPQACAASPSERRASSLPIATEGSDVGRGLSDLQGPSAVNVPDIYRDCTTVIFQRWVFDNWDLYTARGDGSQIAMLTLEPENDEGPSIGPGCRLIAFHSPRGGNDDIYLMSGDSNDLVRVTDHPAQDVLPALSPDRSEVAFQSYRDGSQPEIYLVDLATHTPKRLTQHAAYDGQPDWSPDGQQIAFISEQSGTKNVWVMRRDGSDLRQITFMPHAGGPKWSPDGERIAFASDDVGSGFTSLWVVDADGSDPRLIWRPTGSQTDAWPGDWSFDSRYILYEQADWVYTDAWEIESSALDLIAPDDPGDRQRLIGGEDEINMAPSWAMCDVSPPTSQVAELPPLSTAPFHVSWSGSDDCAGDLSYQIQVRLGGEYTPWLDWQMSPGVAWTKDTRAVWQEVGYTFSFRSRARDALGYVEAWPPGADADTTVPATISGFVGDSREVPIGDAELHGPSSLVPAAYSRISGHYVLGAANEGAAFVSVAAPGYDAQMLSRPIIAPMQEIDLYLEIEPNLLANGGFESGQAGWHASRGTSFPQVNYAYDRMCARLEGSLSGSGSLPQRVGASTLYQVVHIPATMHAPTLSFMYVLGTDGEADAGILRAEIVDASSTVQVFATERPSQWQSTPGGTAYPLWEHGYADLGAWAGATVTLMLQYDPRWTGGLALLDEVSITPWLTPRVDSVSPRSVWAGQETTITVQGANFTAPGSLSEAMVYLGDYRLATSALSDEWIEARIPPTVPKGLYDLEVVNPAGYRGGLAHILSVGHRLTLPLILRITTP